MPYEPCQNKNTPEDYTGKKSTHFLQTLSPGSSLLQSFFTWILTEYNILKMHIQQASCCNITSDPVQFSSAQTLNSTAVFILNRVDSQGYRAENPQSSAQPVNFWCKLGRCRERVRCCWEHWIIQLSLLSSDNTSRTTAAYEHVQDSWRTKSVYARTSASVVFGLNFTYF